MRTSTTEARRHGERSGDLKDKLTAEMRSRGEDQKSTTEAQRHGGRLGDLAIARDRLIKIMQTINATLREIFDESAYDRFLQRTKVPRSVTSYRDFMQEREAGMTRRPKCC